MPSPSRGIQRTGQDKILLINPSTLNFVNPVPLYPPPLDKRLASNVILRNEVTKNLVSEEIDGILRYAQNDVKNSTFRAKPLLNSL